MAMCLNKIQVIGHATEPTREVFKDQAVSKFSVATNDRKKNESGEWADDTTWHRIVAYGKVAELANRFVGKGSAVYVEGKMRHRQYVDKAGQKQTWSDILADRVLLLDKKSDSEPAPRPAANASKDALKRVAEAFDEADSDVPF